MSRAVPSQASIDLEPTWPGLLALVAATLLNWMMPATLTAGPGWLPVAAIAILAAVAHFRPEWHNHLGYAKAGLATLALTYALATLVRDLATQHHGNPRELLWGALLIWSMNVLVSAAWYWRLDEGGPHARSRQEVYCGGAFLFPQLALPAETRRALGASGWRPRFVDYLFVAFNTSTAFSPTDVAVLSPWAKVLMMIQASISLTTLAIVAARAVNML